jgi:predicted nucleotidyltransferase
MLLYTRPDRPVDPLTVQVLRLVDRVLNLNGIRYFIGGASARDLLLSNVLGFGIQRATKDIDFAIAAPSWFLFNKLREELIATGQFRSNARPFQRLYYGDADPPRGYPIDILLFGDAPAIPPEIGWPPDDDIRFNTMGFDESLAAASMVQIADDLAIPVPSLPSLTALKLFAWRDRHDRTTKDALDFAHLLCVYGEAGNQAKLYGPAFNLMEKAEYDVQLAGARLLGAEVRDTMLPETTTALIELLSGSEPIDRLTLQMALHFRSSEDKILAAQRLLSQFTFGLTGA